MTADEKLLTKWDWDVALALHRLGNRKDSTDSDLRAHEAARIEQVERLRGLLRRCEPIVSEAILAARAGDPGFTEDALTDVLTDIRAELAREGQGWR